MPLHALQIPVALKVEMYYQMIIHNECAHSQVMVKRRAKSALK